MAPKNIANIVSKKDSVIAQPSLININNYNHETI